MKTRLLFVLCLLGLSTLSFSKNRRDFFEYIKSFDWNTTEDMYATEHRYLPDCNGYEISDSLFIGDYYMHTAYVKFWNPNPGNMSINAIANTKFNSLPSIAKVKIERILTEELGAPDFESDVGETEYMINSILGYDKSVMRMWYTDTLTLTLLEGTEKNDYGTSTSLYAFQVTAPDKEYIAHREKLRKDGKHRIEPLSGFRSNRWGDSREQCKEVGTRVYYLSDENMDVYELNLSGYKGYVYYYYINGKLEMKGHPHSHWL